MTISTNQLHKQRTEEILLSLDKLQLLSRSQIQKLHNLKSDRNACRVLKSMGKYLNSFRMDENVFYLNKLGREMINSDKIVSKTMQTKHILMRNELYIYTGCPELWLPERTVEVPISKLSIRCDVLYKTDTFHFAEIDHLQSMYKNEQKIRKYAEIKETGGVQRLYKYFPRLVFLTTTEHRKRQLITMCRKYSLSNAVFTLDEIQ